jgi:hypothetical protein
MKNPFYLCWAILLIFAQCDDKTLEKPVSEMIVGSWVNIDGPNAIEMDTENNFIVKFGKSTSDTLKYEFSGANNLIISDAKVRYECEYRFDKLNRLELAIVSHPYSEKKISVYRRIE